jgi:dGTPase
LSIMTNKIIREELELIEATILSEFATLSKNSKGRKKKEEQCKLRTDFQRDRDRIIHSKAFRRLRYKSQVFLAPKGDHYRTRLTHTIEVAQIARVISRALRLNEDLTEAIALGHDLGHTPLGHAGEAVLNRLLKDGFRHNEQSLRVVDFLENDGLGLNLTFEVRNGILMHSKGKGEILRKNKKDLPVTKEGEVVRITDLIAYLCHDLDDAIRARVIKEGDILPTLLKNIGKTHSERINTMVSDVIYSSRNSGNCAIEFSDKIYKSVIALRDFMYENVYESDIVHGEFIKAENILEQLFVFFIHNNDFFYKESGIAKQLNIETQVADFISGMTDRYLLFLYEKFFLPKSWEVF